MKHVFALKPDGEIMEFETIVEAARHFGVAQSTVSMALKINRFEYKVVNGERSGLSRGRRRHRFPGLG